MIQIYLSEGTCKKLCVKVIFRSYNFPEKKNCGKKSFFQKRKYLCSKARNKQLALITPDRHSGLRGDEYDQSHSA
jgi:hypothetical protein